LLKIFRTSLRNSSSICVVWVQRQVHAILQRIFHSKLGVFMARKSGIWLGDKHLYQVIHSGTSAYTRMDLHVVATIKNVSW